MNLYERLGIDLFAAEFEVKGAYKRLVRVHHPDKKGDREEFELLVEAYKLLSDKAKRKAYDEELKKEITLRERAETVEEVVKEEGNIVFECFQCMGEVSFEGDDNRVYFKQCPNCSKAYKIEV